VKKVYDMFVLKLGAREERLFEGQTQRRKFNNEKGFGEVAHDDVNCNKVVEDRFQRRHSPALVNSTAHQAA
jgi:hypothetical protein